MNFITNGLINLGLTRDSKTWLVARLLAVAALVASGAVDLVGLGDWLGWQISAVWAHRIDALAIAVLWLAGKYDSSPLPGGKK